MCSKDVKKIFDEIKKDHKLVNRVQLENLQEYIKDEINDDEVGGDSVKFLTEVLSLINEL